MKKLLIEFSGKNTNASITLPGSKSESNRALVIRFLSGSNFPIQGISSSDDTVSLQSILDEINNRESGEYYLGHSGAGLRFLTAVLSITPGTWILKGSERLCERPLRPLVDALIQLGADISYLGNSGKAPLLIKGKKLESSIIKIESGISSQFISALMMIAPTLPNGLVIKLLGEIVSMPYLEMTAAMMKQAGANVSFYASEIKIAPGKYRKVNFLIEGDWSCAAFWYEIAALSESSNIEIKNLNLNSLQGDSVCPEIFKNFGVDTQSGTSGFVISKIQKFKKTEKVELNCLPFPDLVQAIAVTGAFLKSNLTLHGLQTLKLKETDRIAGLKNELEKFGNILQCDKNYLEIIKAGEVKANENKEKSPIEIDSYNDHRMAMAFAPAALVTKKIVIRDPEVISKSYTGFWDDLDKAGFKLNLI